MSILDELPSWANWIARDKDGELWVYEYTPIKLYTCWDKNIGERAEVKDAHHVLYSSISFRDDEPTEVEELRAHQRRLDSVGADIATSYMNTYIADLTKELYATQERRLQLFLENHPELSITDLYLKGEVANIEVQGTGEGDYMVTQVLPSIYVKPRTTTITGEMSSQAVQDMLNLYSNNKVKITIEVED